MAIESDRLRKWLVATQDMYRRAMLEGSVNQARYYAGRVDALRDVLAFIRED